MVPEQIWPFKATAQAGQNKGPGMWAGSGSRAIQPESFMFHRLRIPGSYLPWPLPWAKGQHAGHLQSLYQVAGSSHPAQTLLGRRSMSLGSWLWGSVLPGCGAQFPIYTTGGKPGPRRSRAVERQNDSSSPEVKAESKLFSSFPRLSPVTPCPVRACPP